MKDKSCVSLPRVLVAVRIAILALGVGAQLSFGQTEKASVSGRVNDQSNAAVPDAQVQIRNTDTNIVTSTQTNSEGIYVIPSLNPGNYVMSVTKQGFRAVSVTGVILNVQDNLSRNFSLQVGSTAESVTVTAEAGSELVETTSSDLGTVIGQMSLRVSLLSCHSCFALACYATRRANCRRLKICLPRGSLAKASSSPGCSR